MVRSWTPQNVRNYGTPPGDGTTNQHGSEATLIVSNQSKKPATSANGTDDSNHDGNLVGNQNSSEQSKNSSKQPKENSEQPAGPGSGPNQIKNTSGDQNVVVIGTKVDLTSEEKEILNENSGLHRAPPPGESNSFSWLAEPGLPYVRDNHEVERDRQVNNSSQAALRKYLLFPPHRLIDHNRSLTRFGFGETSWYFHCSILTQLASDSSVTLPVAQDRAQHVCSKLSSIDILSDLDRFFQLASIAKIKKLK